jgi:hypothetical protein
MTVANRNWGDSRSSSDRSSHKWTPLATSFAHLTHCLFAAGSLGDKTARWARLLDSSLLANPINRQAWNDKLGQLELAGLMAEAVLARSYFDRHLDDITITGHLSLPITPPRFASKAVGPYAGRRDAERIEAEPISPRDLFTLLVTYERSTQTGGGTRGLLELIDQRLRDFVRSEQPSRTAWPMVPVVITAAFTDHYFDGLFARDRMPEALLMSLTTFTDVEEECLGSSRRLFSSLIDDMAKLSEDEYEFFTHQLETSMFYQINHRAIAEVRRKGPSLAVPLLGKLIYFATPGGGGGVLTRDGEFWASY